MSVLWYVILYLALLAGAFVGIYTHRFGSSLALTMVYVLGLLGGVLVGLLSRKSIINQLAKGNRFRLFVLNYIVLFCMGVLSTALLFANIVNETFAAHGLILFIANVGFGESMYRVAYTVYGIATLES